MNYLELKEAKQTYDLMSNAFEMLESKGMIKSPIESLSLKKLLRLEIAQYLMYLSASDGRIDDNEVTVYQVITGFGDKAHDIIDFIKENNIYSTSFESTVPFSMKIAVEAEYIRLRSTGEFLEHTLPELLLGLYEHIGLTLIQADGGVTYNERRDLNIYLNTLKEYMRERGFDTN